MKSGRSRQPPPITATGNGARQSTSLQNFLPTGWAPGPAGKDVSPAVIPDLVITLPEEYTSPLAHKHYEAVRHELRNRANRGGHDGLTANIYARLTVQEFGRVRATVINVTLLLSFVNLC